MTSIGASYKESPLNFSDYHPHICGAYGPDVRDDVCYEYDPRTDQWSYFGQMIYGRSYMGWTYNEQWGLVC